MEEVWKDVQGFEGRYQVSNMGRVRSLDRWSFEPRTKEYWMAHNEKGNARRRPVLQYTAEMALVNRFNSIKEAASATGINQVTISTCCQRCCTKTKTGYLWRYE